MKRIMRLHCALLLHGLVAGCIGAGPSELSIPASESALLSTDGFSRLAGSWVRVKSRPDIIRRLYAEEIDGIRQSKGSEQFRDIEKILDSLQNGTLDWARLSSVTESGTDYLGSLSVVASLDGNSDLSEKLRLLRVAVAITYLCRVGAIDAERVCDAFDILSDYFGQYGGYGDYLKERSAEVLDEIGVRAEILTAYIQMVGGWNEYISSIYKIADDDIMSAVVGARFHGMEFGAGSATSRLALDAIRSTEKGVAKNKGLESIRARVKDRDAVVLEQLNIFCRVHWRVEEATSRLP